MKQLTLAAAVVALALSPAAARANGSPSVAKAKSVTEDKIYKKYSQWFKDYPDAIVSLDCKQAKKLATERRYLCDWSILLGYDGGFDGVDGPSGLAHTYWYKSKPWAVLL